MLCSFLLYNKVNPAICIHISPYPLPLASPSHPPYLTPLGGHRALSWSPCAMQQLPTSYLFYIWQCIYVNATFSLRPSLPTPLKSVLNVCIYSCPTTRFISTIFLDSIYMRLAYGICFSVSDLLDSVWQTLGPSTSLQVTQFRSILWLSNIWKLNLIELVASSGVSIVIWFLHEFFRVWTFYFVTLGLTLVFYLVWVTCFRWGCLHTLLIILASFIHEFAYIWKTF